MSGVEKNPWDNSAMPYALRLFRNLTVQHAIFDKDRSTTYTTRAYFDEELVKIFGLKNVSQIGSILAQLERRTNPTRKIETAKEEIPKSEQAFYRGLMIGAKLTAREVNYQGLHVKVKTESPDASRRALLEHTIGSHGTVIHKKKLSIYLSSYFSFLVDPLAGINARYLDIKENFSPFLAGLMISGLSDKGHKIALPNEKIAAQLLKKFSKHFRDSCLGRIEDKSDRPSFSVVIANPQEIWGLLASTKPVRSLPFFRQLRLPENQTPVKEVEIFPRAS